MIHKIFFGPLTGVWKNLFEDVRASNEFEYCDFYNKCKSPKIERLLFGKPSKFIPNKIKLAIYRKVLKYKFLNYKTSDEFTFIFTNGFEMFADTYIVFFLQFLKKTYPKARFCIHIYESLMLNPNSIIHKTIPYFNLVYSFNKYDADRFGFKYYGGVCEHGLTKPNDKGEESDVFYAGGVSSFERITFVLESFKTLAEMNKKCIFFIATPVTEQLTSIFESIFNSPPPPVPNGFKYHNSIIHFGTYIPYVTNLSYLRKTKCTMEIVLPKGFASCTCRIAQALPNKVKLITNCPTILEESYYNENNVFYYDNPEQLNNIPKSFFQKPFTPINKDFTPLTMIKEMEKDLGI